MMKLTWASLSAASKTDRMKQLVALLLFVPSLSLAQSVTLPYNPDVNADSPMLTANLDLVEVEAEHSSTRQQLISKLNQE